MRDVLSYLYLNAKIMAKEGKFLSLTKWGDLWECTSPGEIASLLEGTDYFYYLSEGAADEARLLEKAILEEYSGSDVEVSAIVPKKAWPIKEYILRKWDIINLRTAMRGIHSDQKKERTADSFIKGGELSFNFFKGLIDAESMDDFVALLEKTPYQSLSEGLAKYNETRNLFFIESLLDKIFWENIWAKTLETRGVREFREFIEICVDTFNLKILLRAKNDGLYLEEIELYLLLQCVLLRELLPAFDEENISGLISLLEGTIYFEPLVSAQNEYEKSGSLLSYEEVLDNLVFKKAEDIRKKKPFGPGPLIGFLALKGLEVKKLLAIVRSTEVNLDREKTRELLMRKEWK